MLSNIGAIAGARRHQNADSSFAGGWFVGGGGGGGGGGRGGVHGGSSPGGVEVEEGPSTTATDDAKGEEILAGIRLLISVRVEEVDPSAKRYRSESENQPRGTDLLEYVPCRQGVTFSLAWGARALKGYTRKETASGGNSDTDAGGCVVLDAFFRGVGILMSPLMMDSFDVSFDDCL